MAASKKKTSKKVAAKPTFKLPDLPPEAEEVVLMPVEPAPKHDPMQGRVANPKRKPSARDRMAGRTVRTQ